MRSNHHAQWKYLNSLPVKIRRKTTSELQEKGKKIQEQWNEDNPIAAQKTKDEIQDILDDYHVSQWDFDKHEYFSTLEGRQLMNARGGFETLKEMIGASDYKTAATIVTVFHENEWKSWIDLHPAGI